MPTDPGVCRELVALRQAVPVDSAGDLLALIVGNLCLDATGNLYKLLH